MSGMTWLGAYDGDSWFVPEAINMEWCKSCGCIRELVLDIGWTNWERPHTLDAEPDGVVAKKEA